MPRTPSRRTVLRGLTVTGAAVTGFDPAARGWAASGTGSGPDLARIPRLDGTLVMDDPSLTAAAEDYGHIVHRRPVAVLRPGSVRDVVVMVRFCNEHRVRVAPRGQGHATSGQAQVQGGLVIETATLADIGPVAPDATTVTVGAGARWSEVAKAALAHGRTPPVFTDYLELSVGGTLSVGGLGGQTHRHGAQVDNVTELQVVTGAGEFVRCSPSRHPDLFHAVSAGLGQCAIVVAATVRLVRAPETVRHYLLPYDDLETFLADQRTLVEEGRFDYVEGLVSADPGGAFRVFTLEAVAYGPPAGPAPDDTLLLRGLRHDPSGVEKTDLAYYDFLDRLAPTVAELKEAGLWTYAHPWLNLLLPGDSAAALTARMLADLTPADLGPGVVLVYPILRERLTTPLFSAPDDPVPYLFAVLRTTPPEDTATVDRLLTANREAYDAAAATGGTQYPVGSIPFTHADWRAHFGAEWPRLEAAKRTYDPRRILVPGQGIF
ncbi:FAD-binding protein [Streptomyces cylindrosporus]|uniref:FAD-binding protein n=1 Tax=Streptomyces cylindrosporus TaxID=2927583 RepID=A0ABS9YCT0_9ACTN|nr:FAD-binding protein [Streptomyces cylindrosporus]MCI3274421.1 FAD-binding protein [Streptomyces cylindrosporus]